VHNNHYTNRMAQKHLHDAAATAVWMAGAAPVQYAQLCKRIGLGEDEIAQWRRAADAMYLPVDERLGIFPQDDNFLDLPRLHVRTEEAKKPLLLRLHPMTIYRHQVCKQADTVLALMLAGENVDRDAKRRNLEYYEGVTIHDSTLSASTFGVVAAEVGQTGKAYRYFIDTLRVDLDDSHGNAAHGIHMAAMAGSWLTFSWGFGGLRVIDGKPSLSPRLPVAWNSYRFGVRWGNAQLRVQVSGEGTTYTLGRGDLLSFYHDGVEYTLRAGETLALTRADSGTSHADAKAVIFDLDGVIADTAVVHLAAWKRLASELRVPFDSRTAERLKGVDRMGSLEILLEGSDKTFSHAEKVALGDRKNTYYVEQIQHFGPQDLLPGARAAVESVRAAGLKTALASASRNAPTLLEKMGIAELFDYVVDAAKVERSKPDPEIFLAAAKGVGIAPAFCIGVEDAEAGVAGIKAAGMFAIGIGDPVELKQADTVLPGLQSFCIDDFVQQHHPLPATLRAGSIHTTT
jgi:beta-phosphoglucomutase